MMPFVLDRPRTLGDAQRAGAEFIAGGTDMVQLLQENIRNPRTLVDLLGVLPRGITVADDGIRIHDGRKSAAADALRLFPGCRQ
jgi:xanthine dehydrogenase YagS FAD-binding subunit